MAPRLRLGRGVLVALILLLTCTVIHGSHSKSLILRPASEIQSQEHSVALLDQGGRTNLVQITSDDGEPLFKRRQPFTHIKASLLSIGLYAMLARNLLWLTSPSRSDWAGFIFLLVLYVVEASTCSTRRYLFNIKTPSQVKEIISELQKVAPRVRWHVECYHYEDDDRRTMYSTRRAHASSQATSSSKRVTHRASELYQFRQ